MKVNWSMDFTDESLRKIKVAMGGRSGKAKRSDVRVWLSGVVLGKLGTINAPPVRKRRVADVAELLTAGDGVLSRSVEKRVALSKKAKGWRCPACKNFVDEEMAKRCKACHKEAIDAWLVARKTEQGV